MGLYKYSQYFENAAYAQAFDLDCSYKDLSQVFRAIKGRKINTAKKILEDCINLKKPVLFKKFNKHLAHRSQLNGKKGKWPVKEAKIALKLLENAEANANYRGLPLDNLFITVANSYKQDVHKRYRRYFASPQTLGYGKRNIYSNYITCRAELILAEKMKK